MDFDMGTPVTRAELREELDSCKADVHQTVGTLDRKVTRLDQTVVALDRKVTQMDQRFTQMNQKLTQMDQKVTRMDQTLPELPGLISAELAQHVKALGEQFRTHIGVVDEKYQDLPGRVTKLEATVVAPKRKRR